MIPRNETESRYCFDLFKAVYDGSFPEVYADYEQSAAPADRKRYWDIGALLEHALRRHRGSAGRVRKLIQWVLRTGDKSDPSLAVQVDALDSIAVRRARADWDGGYEARLVRSFGLFVHLAAACQVIGVAADNDSLADLTLRDFEGEGLSITDIKGAVREFTTFIPLQEWVGAASRHFYATQH